MQENQNMQLETQLGINEKFMKTVIDGFWNKKKCCYGKLEC